MRLSICLKLKAHVIIMEVSFGHDDFNSIASNNVLQFEAPQSVY